MALDHCTASRVVEECIDWREIASSPSRAASARTPFTPSGSCTASLRRTLPFRAYVYPASLVGVCNVCIAGAFLCTENEEATWSLGRSGGWRCSTHGSCLRHSCSKYHPGVFGMVARATEGALRYFRNLSFKKYTTGCSPGYWTPSPP